MTSYPSFVTNPHTFICRPSKSGADTGRGVQCNESKGSEKMVGNFSVPSGKVVRGRL